MNHGGVQVKSFIGICNNLMTHTCCQTIKVGIMLVPLYSIVWLAVRIGFLLVRER